MKKNIIIASALWFALPLCAQSTFDKFKQQQQQQYNQFKKDSQAEYDAFRKKANEEYAEFMRQAWEAFPAHEAEKPKKEKDIPPVVYEEPKPTPQPKTEPQPTPKPDEKPAPQPTPQPKPKDDEKPVEIRAACTRAKQCTTTASARR